MHQVCNFREIGNVGLLYSEMEPSTYDTAWLIKGVNDHL